MWSSDFVLIICLVTKNYRIEPSSRAPKHLIWKIINNSALPKLLKDPFKRSLKSIVSHKKKMHCLAKIIDICAKITKLADYSYSLIVNPMLLNISTLLFLLLFQHFPAFLLYFSKVLELSFRIKMLFLSINTGKVLFLCSKRSLLLRCVQVKSF